MSPRKAAPVTIRDQLAAELPEGFEFDARDLTLIEVGQAIANRIDELQAEIASTGVWVAGSKGQQRLNPLVPEVRLQQMALVRTIEAIHIPADDTEPEKSARHQKAARRRWDREQAQHG